jgi:16S rRNA C1402 (ribose-2'-O) methylase RsmI
VSINLRELEALRQRANRACEYTRQLQADLRKILTEFGIEHSTTSTRKHSISDYSSLLIELYYRR